MLGIINMILAGLTIKNNIKKKNLLPSFRGILEVKHYIKGRLRIKVPLIMVSIEAQDIIKQELSKIPAIENITINPTTGSITFVYDEEEIEAIILISAVLKLLNLEKDIHKIPESRLSKEFNEYEQSLNRAINEKSHGLVDLYSVVILLLLGTGVYSMIKGPILPNGLTLLWWAHELLLKNRRSE